MRKNARPEGSPAEQFEPRDCFRMAQLRANPARLGQIDDSVTIGGHGVVAQEQSPRQPKESDYPEHGRPAEVVQNERSKDTGQKGTQRRSGRKNAEEARPLRRT